MPKPWEWHPVAVHFAVAILMVAALFKALGVFRKNAAFDLVSFWLLRLGFLAAIATAGLGLLAAKTAPHVPAAWETLYDHKWLGISTASTSAALWIIEEIRRRHSKAWLVWVGYLLWVAVVVLVIATGNEGGELVYTHGLGVAAAPHL